MGGGCPGGVESDFGDEEGAVEDIGVLADGGDVTEVDGVLAAGKAALPAAFFCLQLV